VTLTTNLGPIELELNTPKAPCTANNFRSLVARHYYDNTPCHRLTTEGIYVLQCGDPTGQGTGGPGYTFADENLEGAKYPRGTVAMANSGAGTNGSQFFLVYKDTQLDPNYTPFGTITKGLDLLEKVAKAGSTPPSDGKPKLAVKIISARARPKA
jgi:peptidyl-prolyl cis-trans isomerase B (cyclophilin B)